MRIVGGWKRLPLAVRAAVICAFCVGGGFFVLNFPKIAPASNPTFGVTFTPGQAGTFGLPWREAYAALLDDLRVRNVRLVAYWDAIEPTEGSFFFDDLDYQLNELAARGGKAIFAIGRKTPRWPECHDPSWLSVSSKKDLEIAIQRMITAVVTRYRGHPALGEWQVENEVMFPFGICPNMLGLDTLEREVELVRTLDSRHKIMVTDGGEWSAWFPIGLYGDVAGVSLYREAWNTLFGYVPFPISPGWYQVRAKLLGLFGRPVIISELQAEPWGEKAVQEMSVAESLAAMPLEKLQQNIAFSKEVGFSRAYLWGAEWWYWLKTNGDARVWDMMRGVFH